MRAPTLTQKRARRLRKDMSLPEVLLWRLIRGRKPVIRKQHPIGPYILDFYCSAARLCIEIDGQQHDADHDARRDAWLAEQGIETLRFTAIRVLQNPDEMAVLVLQACADRLPR